jgi:hypothetical protein
MTSAAWIQALSTELVAFNEPSSSPSSRRSDLPRRSIDPDPSPVIILTNHILIGEPPGKACPGRPQRPAKLINSVFPMPDLSARAELCKLEFRI